MRFVLIAPKPDNEWWIIQDRESMIATVVTISAHLENAERLARQMVKRLNAEE